MTGPEQHAATERVERLAGLVSFSMRFTRGADARGYAALDELVALAGQTRGETTLAMFLNQQERAEAAVARADELQRERDEARESANKLNRRATQAEAVVMQTVEDCKRQGVSFGRALANAACNKLSADLEHARREADQLRAALRTASGLIWEGSVGNARAVIDAALAGVQADTPTRLDEAEALIRRFHESCWNHDGDLPDEIEGAASAALAFLGDTISLVQADNKDSA